MSSNMKSGSVSQHQSAKASHYNKDAEDYDHYNEVNSRVMNQLILEVLQKHKVARVLDLTCGTGSQVFCLAKKGFEVVGSDINAKMLAVAKQKAEKAKLPLKFIKGDMRTLSVGEFDAVITIFNAIGHLTKDDFAQAIRNVWKNLKSGGLYIFDINNLSYLLSGENITKLTIDWLKRVEEKQIRYVQYSTIDEAGVLASYTTAFSQEKNGKLVVSKQKQTLQVYTAGQLRELLEANGFKVLRQCGTGGSRLSETKTDCILTVAKKV